MLYVNKITADPTQNLRLTGIPGVIINMTLRFMPRDQFWIAGFNWNNFTANGIRVTTAPNFLRQFKNNIPFGMTCLMASGLDPFNVNDFANQAANLYLLDSSDVAAVEKEYFT